MKITKERAYVRELLSVISEAQESAKRDKIRYQVCRCGKHLLALPADEGIDAWSDVLLDISA